MQLIKAAAAFAVLATFAATPIAAAQEPQVAVPAVQGALLTINAEGSVEGAPDMAIINLGVTTEGRTAAEALAENSRRSEALIAALRRAGIAERDIQTSNVSVYPQQQYIEGQPPRIIGYQANNSVTVKVRRIDTTGRVIDAAVGAGSNTVNGVSFTYQDPDAQMDAARRDAIAGARARAALYADALGMRVHRVVAVSEGGGFAPPIIAMPYERMAAADGAAAPPPPIAPGQIETRVSVSVTFELR
ncbi:MAG: SIMPL domain-containing protein [Hyphomonadaceae bacterium]|nr:SIMPL domain-containing protein [Hyphomonadaceae bacterium]